MSQPGFAGQKRIIDVNANSGAFVKVLATTTSRRVVIDESPITSAGAANTLQNALQYQIPNDGTTNGFTTIFQTDNSAEGIIGATGLPIVLGNPMAGHEALGEIIGQVGQPIVGAGTQAATQLINVRSGTSTATSIVVVEYN
jgi:hypothetical protein